MSEQPLNIKKKQSSKPELVSESTAGQIVHWLCGGFFSRILCLIYFISFLVMLNSTTAVSIGFLLVLSLLYGLLIRFRLQDLKSRVILHILPDTLELRIKTVGTPNEFLVIPLIQIKNIQKVHRNWYMFQYAERYDEPLKKIEFHSYDGPRSYSFLSFFIQDDSFNSAAYYLYEMVQFAKKKTTN